jgi:hypothetical protein
MAHAHDHDPGEIDGPLALEEDEKANATPRSLPMPKEHALADRQLLSSQGPARLHRCGCLLAVPFEPFNRVRRTRNRAVQNR